VEGTGLRLGREVGEGAVFLEGLGEGLVVKRLAISKRRIIRPRTKRIIILGSLRNFFMVEWV